MTRDTVSRDTPASVATSRIVGSFIRFSLCVMSDNENSVLFCSTNVTGRMTGHIHNTQYNNKCQVVASHTVHEQAVVELINKG